MGTKIPARCSRCGKLDYIVNAVSMHGPSTRAAHFAGTNQVAGAMFIDCTFLSHCRCGGELVSLKGSYAMNGEGATLIDGPQSSWDALTELSKVVAASLAAGESAEKTLERASAFFPWLRNGLKGKLAAAAFGVLTFFATKAADQFIDPMLNEPTVTIEQVEKAMRDAVKEASSQSTAPKSDGMSVRPDLHPMLIEFPTTAKKLVDYEKSRSKNH